MFALKGSYSFKRYEHEDSGFMVQEFLKTEPINNDTSSVWMPVLPADKVRSSSALCHFQEEKTVSHYFTGFFWSHSVACGILASQPGTESGAFQKSGILTDGQPGNYLIFFYYW